MTPQPIPTSLNREPLNYFRHLFTTLDALTVAEVNGRYHSQFIGPAWVRTLAPPSLALVGMGSWCGKVFDGPAGMNRLKRQDEIIEAMPVALVERPSLIDNQPTLTVTYPATSRWPWPHIIDELRRLDTNTLLGMTMAKPLGLHRIAFPFLLHRDA